MLNLMVPLRSPYDFLLSYLQIVPNDPKLLKLSCLKDTLHM